MDHLTPTTPNELEYSVFDHPLLPRQLVCTNENFSFPVFVLGPFWFLWRRLWAAAAIALVGGVAGYWLVGVTGSATCSNVFGVMDYECLEKYQYGPWLVQFFVHVLSALLASKAWADDLLRRGYRITKVIQAKSADHARAILAERGDWQDTRPAS
jgi:hypothetical protein